MDVPNAVTQLSDKQMTLEEMLVELTAHYETHKTAPGIQCAYLRDKKLYYVAVHIFPHGVESRTVYAKGTDANLGVAMSKCLAAWRKRVADES